MLGNPEGAGLCSEEAMGGNKRQSLWQENGIYERGSHISRNINFTGNVGI